MSTTLNVKTVAGMFAIFTAALVMLVSATLIQSYQGRVDVQRAQTIECREAVKLRNELITFQKITLSLIAPESAAAGDLRSQIRTLEARSTNCEELFPKPKLISGFTL